MSPITAVWCVVCGLDFEPIEVHDPNEVDMENPDERATPWWADSYLNSNIISEEQVEWMGDIHVIGPLQQHPFVDTIGELYSDVVRPAIKRLIQGRQEVSATIPGFRKVGRREGDWDFFADVFPIHGSCAEILHKTLSRRSEQADDKGLPTSIARVHEILEWRAKALHAHNPKYLGWCGPDPRSMGFTLGMAWQRGYFGAEQFWGQSFEIEHSEGFEYLCADPLEKKSECTTAAILDLLRPVSPAAPKSPGRQASGQNLNTSKEAPLIKLPVECLELIVAYLPTTSALYLHRTCRTLAFMIPLNQRFWREELINGKLIPYIWPGDVIVSACRSYDVYNATDVPIKTEGFERYCNSDWKRLCKLLLAQPYTPGIDEDYGIESQLELLPLGIRNRRRIWAVAKAIGYEEAAAGHP